MRICVYLSSASLTFTCYRAVQAFRQQNRAVSQPSTSDIEHTALKFESPKEAAHRLDLFMDEIAHISGDAQSNLSQAEEYSALLKEENVYLTACLDSWLLSLKSTMESQSGVTKAHDERIWEALQECHRTVRATYERAGH